MCTAIKIDYDDGTVLGRTMDLEPPLEYGVYFLDKDQVYGPDLLGEDIVTRYKTMGMSFHRRKPLKDGINEHGLIGVTNDYGGFNLYTEEPVKDKVNIASLDFLSYVLSHYKSVDELIEDLPNLNIAKKDHLGREVLSPAFHHIFTDPSKRTVVIEPLKGKLVAYDNPYGVMTNSPGFESHERRLKKRLDLDNLQAFNSAKELPGGYDPGSRFFKAFYLTKAHVPSKTAHEALANSFNILGAMALPKGFIKTDSFSQLTYTMYTSSYDSTSKRLIVRGSHDPRVRTITLDDLKNKKEGFISLEDMELY